MPATRDNNAKSMYGRSMSHNEMSLSARVYHPATNLMPPTPPVSPTGLAPSFSSNSKPGTFNSWNRQSSQGGGKYS